MVTEDSIVPNGGSAAPAPKRRRRRRKKPSAVPKSNASDLVALEPSLAQEEVEEALSQPLPSVVEQEGALGESESVVEPVPESVPPSLAESVSEPAVTPSPQPTEPFLVSMAPEEPSESKDLVYEAPVYQGDSSAAPTSPTISSQEVVVEPAPAAAPMQDPFSAYQSPFDSVDPFQPMYGAPPAAPAGGYVDPYAPAYAEGASAPAGGYTDPYPPAYGAPAYGAPASGQGAYGDPYPYSPQGMVDPFQPVAESAPVPESAPAPIPEPAPQPVFEPSPTLPVETPRPETPPVETPPVVEAPFEPIAPSSAPIVNAPVEGELVDSVPARSEGSVSAVAPAASASTVKEAEKPTLSQAESWKDHLQDLLEEANLTPRHLRFCCSGLVVIALMIGLAVFFLPRLLNSDSAETPVETPPVEVPEETPVASESPSFVPTWLELIASMVDEAESNSDSSPSSPQGDTSWVDPSVYTGLLMGQPSEADQINHSTGTEVGSLVGENSVEAPESEFSQFQQFLTDLQSLYTIYFVDIQALLDGAENRTEALDTHIAALRTLYASGTENYDDITVILDHFQSSFDEAEEAKVEAEAQFFEEVDAFDGAEAEVHLETFIEVKQDQVELKAKYLAFKDLQSRYETVMNAVFPLIQDLEANREALIAGVQVVDVIGSDLDLILGEDDLEAAN